MRESLHVCGSILTTDDYHFFALCCAKCDTSFGQWSGFLKHLSSKHDYKVPVKSEQKEPDPNEEYEEVYLEAAVKQELEYELSKQNNNDAATDEKVDDDKDDNGGPHINIGDDDSGDEPVNDDCSSMKSEEAGTLDVIEHNDETDNSSDDTPLNELKKKKKLFYFDPSEANAREASFKFLKVLEKHPLLWDQQHTDYWVPEKRTNSLFTIKQHMARLGYSIPDSALRRTIQRIVRDYKAAKQELAVCGRLDERSALIIKKCKFLDGLESPQKAGTPGTPNETGNDTDVDDSFDNQMHDNDYDDDDVSVSSAPGSVVDGQDQINAFCKNSRYGKRIGFHLTSNPLVDEFVSLLRDNPVLWEVGQFHNFSERKRIMESWIPLFQERHNIVLTYKDLALNLKVLRRTLAKMEERKVLGKTAQRLKDMCSFLPKLKPILRLKCGMCDRNFLTEHNLQAHMYSAHNIGTNPFKCEVCGRDFAGHNQLDTHLRRVHLKQFTVYCDVCNRGYLQHSAMILHRQTHTGEKTFICETCGKAFRRKINMQQHMLRIHLRQRNFACELCPKTFYLKCHLRDHMNAHLNIRNHKCPTCGKGFHSSHTLMRHKQIHAEVKRYACKLCDARFHQFVGLNSHMKNKHKFVNEKDEDAPPAVVHMTTLPATTTADTSLQINTLYGQLEYVNLKQLFEVT